MKLKQKSQITERTKTMLAERKKGKSIVEIAHLFNCSRQLVYSKLKKYGDPLDRDIVPGDNGDGGKKSKKVEQK